MHGTKYFTSVTIGVMSIFSLSSSQSEFYWHGIYKFVATSISHPINLIGGKLVEMKITDLKRFVINASKIFQHTEEHNILGVRNMHGQNYRTCSLVLYLCAHLRRVLGDLFVEMPG